ncbi:MAG: PqqD family peptide modification chaperone [Thioalkalivibrio sp.]|nr:PqqD family peptide modification chaperone [Thioalkalivibrio sp.]
MRTPSAIELTTTVARTNGIFEAEVGPELAMLSIERGRYYSLNHTGRAIWRGLELPIRVKDICDSLQEAFDVDRGTCEEETLELLRELLGEGLVRVV